MGGFRFEKLNPWSREGVAVWLAWVRTGFAPDKIGAGCSSFSSSTSTSLLPGDIAFVSLHGSQGPLYNIMLGTLVDISSEIFMGQWREGVLAIIEKQASELAIEEMFIKSQVYQRLDELITSMFQKGIGPDERNQKSNSRANRDGDGKENLISQSVGANRVHR